MDQMILHKAGAKHIRQFHNLWAKLPPRAPTPCPICYLEGKDQALVELPLNIDVELFKCAVCNSLFENSQN
ncbi:MAG: hypothetical protein Q7T66_06505 [Herminiimonas sp.]|nr:hypothetical protein [Herminiimonas sp.]